MERFNARQQLFYTICNYSRSMLYVFLRKATFQFSVSYRIFNLRKGSFNLRKGSLHLRNIKDIFFTLKWRTLSSGSYIKFNRT